MQGYFTHQAHQVDTSSQNNTLLLQINEKKIMNTMTENNNNRRNLQSQLEDITNSYSSSKSRLKPRHIPDFINEVDNDVTTTTTNNNNNRSTTDDLFYEFARTVCLASVIPRKEVLEAWAMALYVYSMMFQSTECRVTRFADLACSHGLVSWALLLLLDRERERRKGSAEEKGETTGDNYTIISAVCVDIRMPPSAERVAKVFLKEYPQFEGRWDYVEGSVDAIQPASTCLLLGVHACGTLSDRIVQLAMKGNSPLALVPCCHSKKSLTDEQIADPMFLAGSNNKSFLSEYLDQYRIQQLTDAEFIVTEEYIPESITPKNRLILAFPPPTNEIVDTTNTDTIVPVISHMLKAYQMPKIAIPVADTPKAKGIVKTMAGRDAALERRKSPSPRFSFTTVVTPPTELVTKLQLLEWVNPNNNTNINNNNNDTDNNNNGRNSTTGQIGIENVNEYEYIDPKTGNSMITYQFIYPRGMDKQRAKQLHIEFCHQLPVTFPGVWARQIPR